ncbi:MAG TPA: radical SAM protein [Candidatus Deferrimicrobiaceae bacterium]
MATKLLLINPPGRKTYLRDYYCSKVSKTGYCPQPIDLVVLSGLLHAHAEIRVIDAIVGRVSPGRCLDRIRAFSPDAAVSLIGAASIQEDLAFLEELKRHVPRLYAAGDAVLGDTKAWLLSHPFVDGAITDFTQSDIASFLCGESALSRGIATPDSPAGPAGGESPFEIPLPRHELFQDRRYRFPFVRTSRFATVLTDFGCPCRCRFCIMGTLGHRVRTVRNVIDELRLLKSLGTREIFFIDQTFGFDEARMLALCGQMSRESFGFGWACFTRADLIPGKRLEAMRRAGCHTAIMGIESGNAGILSMYGKGMDAARIREGFRLCRKAGIRTVATIILGLPEETEETARETFRLVMEIDPDFLSVNVAVPRPGTALRESAVAEGLIDGREAPMDQSGSFAAMPSRRISRDGIAALRTLALRGFYLRPAYLLKRMGDVRTLHELLELARQGFAVIRSAGR